MLTRCKLIINTFILSLLITAVLAQPPTDSRGGKTKTASTASDKSTAYGIVVGISDYQLLPDLQFADRDALVFADYLVRSAGVPTSQVETLINKQATLINLTDALTNIKKKVNPSDRVYVYFAGHGDIETKNDSTENAMLMLYGADRQDYNATFDKCYLRDMKRWLDEMTEAGAEVVFVADACRSGAFALIGGQLGQTRTMLGLKEQWEKQIKILSCEPGELAIEGKEFGNGRGLFSYCLVDGLMGMADSDKDHVVTKSELEVYLKTTVPKTAKPHIQHPELLGGEGDMPIGKFNTDSLRIYQQRKTRDYSLLTATQTKGFEADLLRGQDSTTRQVYGLFEQALTARKLLHPADQSALHYLRQFPARNNAKILGLMKRNLVAALQVRTEGLLRPMLREIREYEPPTPTSQLDSAIAEMDTSIVLMGRGHNLIQNLTARRLFLEGERLLTTEREYDNDSLSLLAMTCFRESARLEPNMPYTYWKMSETSRMLLQIDSQMVYLEKCRELLPNSVAILNQFGGQYKIRHQLQKAQIYFEKSLQLDANDPYAHAGLAEIFYDLGDEKAVKAHTQKALLVLEKQFAGKDKKKELLISKGRLYRSIGQYETAISLCRDLLKIDSTAAGAYAELSIIYVWQEKWNESIKASEKCIQLLPNSGKAHILRSLCYFRQFQKNSNSADLQKAITSADKSLKLNPGNYMGLVIRSFGEFYRNNYPLALTFARKSVQSNPSYAEAHFLMSLISIALNDTTQARISLYRADSLNFPKASINQVFGLLFEARKEYMLAERSYRKAIALAPDDATNLTGLIKSLLFQKKNPDEILSLCQRLQKIKPINEDVWLVVGHIY